MLAVTMYVAAAEVPYGMLWQQEGTSFMTSRQIQQKNYANLLGIPITMSPAGAWQFLMRL
jgi:hypothetical protein